MFNVDDISGIGDHILAYKIVEKKYVENIVNRGQIYFGLLENYRRMENISGNSIGDRYEASLSTMIAEYIKIDGKYVEIHGPTTGCNARINANQCAFCFYMVGLKAFDKCTDGRYTYTISSSDLDVLCQDKGGVENCAIITFDINTIGKIYDELKQRKLYFASNKVIYDDFHYKPENPIDSWKYAIECAFHKLKIFSYQNEFRIVALNTAKQPIDDLFIDVTPDDFQVLSLKSGHDFCSNIELQVSPIDDKIVGVHFTFSQNLQTNGNNK